MIYINQHSKSILNRSEAIYICDENGYIKLFNKAAALLWGREPELSKELYCGAVQLLKADGEMIQQEEYPVVKIIKENKAIEATELIVLRPDGSRKKILQSSTPVFDRVGKLTGTVNLLIDVSDKN